MRLNFESPEWPTKRNKLVVKLRNLAQVIEDEQKLNNLIEVYREHSVISVTAGPDVDADGRARLLCEVLLNQEDVLPVIVDTLKRQIVAKRWMIEQLFGEITD